MEKEKIKKREKIGIILLGNGLSSSFEIGVLKILLKKINPDLIIATSMGATNACYVFKDKNIKENLKNAEQRWIAFDPSELFRYNKEIFFRPLFAKSLYKNKGIKKMLLDCGEFCNQNLEEMHIPIYIGAVNLETRKTEFFDKGSVFHSLMASCAVPFYFPPYLKEGTPYIDGSLNPRASIDFALKKDLDKIIVINLIKRKPKISSIFSHILSSIEILRTENIEELPKTDSRIKIISPDEKHLPEKITDASKIKDLIKHGEDKAKEFLKTYK